MGIQNAKGQAGRPAPVTTNAPQAGPPVLGGCDRKADGVDVRIILPNVNQRFANVEAYAESHHRMALEAILGTLSGDAWAPVVRAVEGTRQAQDVRAEADRAEREIGRLQIELSEVRGNRRMPGQEKLARERALTGRIQQVQGIHQGNLRDAQELERRAADDQQAAHRLARDLAARAVGEAAQALVREGDAELRAWAQAFPVAALLVADCNGPAAVEKLTAELSGWMERGAEAQVNGARGGPTDGPMPPDNAEPEVSARCPHCQGPMAFSERANGWRCVDCGNFIGEQAAHAVRPGPAPQVNAVPTRSPGPNERPAFSREATGYPAPVNNAPMLGNLTDHQPFPYYENWPPADGADPSVDGYDVPLGGANVQPAGGSDGSPGNAYAVAQEAYARAQQQIALGAVPPPPRGAAMVDAPPTTAFDRTNGGWNQPPGANNNGVPSGPFNPADVDAAARGTFLGSPGPAVELGPNDFPGL